PWPLAWSWTWSLTLAATATATKGRKRKGSRPMGSYAELPETGRVSMLGGVSRPFDDACAKLAERSRGVSRAVAPSGIVDPAEHRGSCRPGITGRWRAPLRDCERRGHGVCRDRRCAAH